MKKAITLRLEPEIIAEAKQAAQHENRSLTNLIETLLKQHFVGAQIISSRSDKVWSLAEASQLSPHTTGKSE